MVDRLSWAHVIVTTPERLDSITRRCNEGAVRAMVQSVRLLLMDEVHTVSERRGAALEAVVSRMKMMASMQPAVPLSMCRHTCEKEEEHDAEEGVTCDLTCTTAEKDGTPSRSTCAAMRVIAMSATLSNVHDFAAWLHVPPCRVFHFDHRARPLPLRIHVLAFPNDSHNPFALDRFLSLRLCALVRQYSHGRPCLVFCVSRRDCVSTARQLVRDIEQLAQRARRTHELRPAPALQTRLAALSDASLQACLQRGVAYHHAALTAEDRELVEQLFREEWVSVLCSTTTLALGVNLPAHVVVVKGTTFFRAHGGREELPMSELMQMCGRAGRLGGDGRGGGADSDKYTHRRAIPIPRGMR